VLINEALCKRFIDARLLFAITVIMNTHTCIPPHLRCHQETIKTSSDTAQLKLCLSCLRTLSNTQQGKEEICQSGVLEPAFKLLSGNSEVVRQAVMFLAALCIRHSESTRRMRIGGCFEKVIDVMSGNLKNGDLQRSCCILVRNGAAQDEKIKVNVYITVFESINTTKGYTSGRRGGRSAAFSETLAPRKMFGCR